MKRCFVSWCFVSWFLGSKVYWFQSFSVSSFLSFLDVWFQRFLVSSFLEFFVSWFLRFLVSWFLHFFVSWLLDFLVYWFLVCFVSWFLRFFVSSFLGLFVSSFSYSNFISCSLEDIGPIFKVFQHNSTDRHMCSGPAFSKHFIILDSQIEKIQSPTNSKFPNSKVSKN